MLSQKYLEDVTFANPNGETMLVDAKGYMTGEKVVSYSAPQTVKAFVSANSGSAVLNAFGFEERYDKMLMIADNGCNIEEGAVLWLGTATTLVPTQTEGKYTVGEYPYLVKKVGYAKCLSYLPVGLSKVSTL